MKIRTLLWNKRNRFEIIGKLIHLLFVCVAFSFSSSPLADIACTPLTPTMDPQVLGDLNILAAELYRYGFIF
jgi:hypothetical protein